MFDHFTHEERRIAWTFAAIKLLAHFLTNTQYTFHRDELLYIDEGKHLAWGFLEVPPLTPFLGRIATLIAGDGIFGIRLLPALASMAMLLLMLIIVKKLGGGKRAMILSGLAYLLSPAFLRSGTLFQPVCLDQLWWVAIVLCTLSLLQSGRKADYIILGVILGLGWLTKYTVVFIALSVFVAVLITSQRRNISWPGLATALLIAGVLALPNLIWQYQHRFPVINHMEELATTQLVHVNPAGFVAGQFLMQFAGVLIWLPGVIWLLFSREASPYRFLGWTYLFVLIFILALSGKDYYTLGVYPVMMAAGGVAVGQWTSGHALRFYPIVGALITLNLMILPLGLPVLGIENLIRYCAFLSSIGIEQRWEDGKVYPLPQDYADMQAWEEIPQMVAAKYHSLPPDLKATCLIFGGGYHHAGALNYYRKKYDLPEAMSLNASYILWPPDNPQCDNMIIVDSRWQDGSPLFHSHVFVDSIRHPYARDPGYVFYASEPTDVKDALVMEWISQAKEPFIREK